MPILSRALDDKAFQAGWSEGAPRPRIAHAISTAKTGFASFFWARPPQASLETLEFLLHAAPRALPLAIACISPEPPDFDCSHYSYQHAKSC